MHRVPGVYLGDMTNTIFWNFALEYESSERLHYLLSEALTFKSESFVND